MGVPEEQSDGIMHVSYPIGSSTLMGSDVLSGFGPPMQMGNNFSISYSPQSREQMDELFPKISEGGTVTMAPGRHVLGLLLRRLCRQVRRRLAVQL